MRSSYSFMLPAGRQAPCQSCVSERFKICLAFGQPSPQNFQLPSILIYARLVGRSGSISLYIHKYTICCGRLKKVAKNQRESLQWSRLFWQFGLKLRALFLWAFENRSWPRHARKQQVRELHPSEAWLKTSVWCRYAGFALQWHFWYSLSLLCHLELCELGRLQFQQGTCEKNKAYLLQVDGAGQTVRDSRMDVPVRQQWGPYKLGTCKWGTMVAFLLACFEICDPSNETMIMIPTLGKWHASSAFERVYIYINSIGHICEGCHRAWHKLCWIRELPHWAWSRAIVYW